MAALVILSDVKLAGERVQPLTVQAGEALNQGECVRVGFDTGESASKYYKANHTTQNDADSKYITLCGADADDYVLLAQPGNLIEISAGIVVGTIYCVGPNDGEIVPWADLASGDYVTVLGYGEAANQLRLFNKVTGVTIP